MEANPVAGLYRDKRGNLYGTTLDGGANDAGTVFKVAADGREKVLHSLGAIGDGSYPSSPLISDSAGNFYGTTTGGGAYNLGTIFSVARDGTETVLHSFRANDGAPSYAGLISDSRGNLYGTTYEYGAQHCGTVFRLAPGGRFKMLYAFEGYPSDGCHSYAGLKADNVGDLYGTTFGDGVENVNGTVFRLAADGRETVLYSFQGLNDCGFPEGGLIGNRSGSVLYGTTSGGGYPCSTVFKIKDGVQTVLHSFSEESDGTLLLAPLLQDDLGNLYGTATAGGAYNDGTIFKVSDK